MNLKEYIFNYRLKRHLKGNTLFPKLHRVRTVLLLFESDIMEKNLRIKQLQKELSAQGKEVTAWGYVDRKDGQTAILPAYRVLCRKDINLIGCPKTECLNQLRKQHFDLVIDLSLRSVLPLRYLLMEARTDFRAGRQTEEPYLSDLMITLQEKNDETYLLQQIMHYLNNIQTTD